MASEWTKNDVLRVMREEEKDSTVPLGRVRERFNLQPGRRTVKFNEALARLCSEQHIELLNDFQARLL